MMAGATDFSRDLSKQQWSELDQVTAPDRPRAVAFGRRVFVTNASFFQHGDEFVVPLEQKVVLAAGDPEELEVAINRLGALQALAEAGGRRRSRAECADVAECVVMIHRDRQGVMPPHRQAGEGPRRWVLSRPVAAGNERHSMSISKR